jgi:dihydrofolate synthase/folylpolyglutamate synthase
MYQRVGKAAYKADLANTLLLAEYLHHPEKSFKSIHVAGTNGKGSTSHMLASVLQEAGYKVGLYTSPHLKDFRERIKINGELIPKRTVSNFVTKHRSFFEARELSFFEMTVGLAFDYFRSEKIDIAIIEVGMGGRLDSTNIIEPEVSVITNIGLDHTQFLGSTLGEIAIEKAGIIKPGVPVVIGETISETEDVFLKIAEERNAEITFAEEIEQLEYPSDLLGLYQKKNKKTVLATLRLLKNRGWNLSERAIRSGLKNVVKNTGLMGRWQQIQEFPKVICDTAHNKAGLLIVLKQIENETFKNLHIVLGTVNDKDLDEVLPLFPKKAIYYFCKPDVPRGLDVNELAVKAVGFELYGKRYTSVKKAYMAALKNAIKDDFIFVGGSTFVVAQVL